VRGQARGPPLRLRRDRRARPRVQRPGRRRDALDRQVRHRGARRGRGPGDAVREPRALHQRAQGRAAGDGRRLLRPVRVPRRVLGVLWRRQRRRRGRGAHKPEPLLRRPGGVLRLPLPRQRERAGARERAQAPDIAQLGVVAAAPNRRRAGDRRRRVPRGLAAERYRQGGARGTCAGAAQPGRPAAAEEGRVHAVQPHRAAELGPNRGEAWRRPRGCGRERRISVFAPAPRNLTCPQQLWG
jgi:hypothetical protein